MAREVFITLYLFAFRILFHIFKRFPQKKKTVFVASFGDNILYTLKEVEKQTNDQVVILQTSQCKTNFHQDHLERRIINFEPKQLLDWIRSIYHLATASTIFIDNYYGFLAVSKFRPNVRCIQLWHAAGAIKKFGLFDPSNKNRSQLALNRFHNVYNQFNHVTVGSDRMADIFKQSFGLTDENMLKTGIPRSDFFFDEVSMGQAAQSLYKVFPTIKKKRVILYAPTFRNNQMTDPHIGLEIENMYKQLHEEYVLLLKLHPSINGTIDNDYPDFVINVSNGYEISHLLTVTDILVTDYSSIPFEFSLLQKPMIFFAYDLEAYRKERGFWEDYETLVPGPVARTTEELVTVILRDEFDLEQVKTFAKDWNQYSNGNSSSNTVQAIYKDRQRFPQ